ncbi:MAG: hypothetical protein AAF548_16800 [Actinomycetota bacterium]
MAAAVAPWNRSDPAISIRCSGSSLPSAQRCSSCCPTSPTRSGRCAPNAPAYPVEGIASHILGDDLSRQRDDAMQGLTLYAETHAGLDFRQLPDGEERTTLRA